MHQLYQLVFFYDNASHGACYDVPKRTRPYKMSLKIAIQQHAYMETVIMQIYDLTKRLRKNKMYMGHH